MIDYKAILDNYWPVIEEAIKVQDHYAGSPKTGVAPKICPDATGKLIETLIKCRLNMPIKRTENA